MGKLIRSFNFNRNAFKGKLRNAAEQAVAVSESVQTGKNLLGTTDKNLYNRAAALSNSMGILTGSGEQWQVNELGEAFLRLWEAGETDAWRWLVTRALWLYTVPNGTKADVNEVAKNQGISFGLFRLLLRVVMHLQAEKDAHRFLFYEEFCAIFDNDHNWQLDAEEVFGEILQLRTTWKPVEQRKGFLQHLDVRYSIPRDNFNGFFNTALKHTGLFTYVNVSGGPVGIALRSNLDSVLQERVRFVVDHPVSWDPSTQSWESFIALRKDDLPLKVATDAKPPKLGYTTSSNLESLTADLFHALSTSGFRISREMLRRYIASILAKRFAILSGLSGSGKTKLAQLTAAWLDTVETVEADPFRVGTNLVSSHTTYEVVSSTPEFIQLRSSGIGKLASLPRSLIREWASTIQVNGYSESTSADTIRDHAKQDSQHEPFIHGWASQLKAAALKLIESDEVLVREQSRYLIVPVEANWTSTEDVFGYADALDPSRFVRRPTLDLILRASANYNSDTPSLPYFLILDEMNLSHVERYFASMLSAIESGEPISLHQGPQERDGVPAELTLPPNLFVVGTVNVDETTYMFSPKVLDRANVIEFRVAGAQVRSYLKDPYDIDLESLRGKGVSYAEPLVQAVSESPHLDDEAKQSLEEEAGLFFDALSEQEVEFGFRTAKEMARFLQFHRRLTDGEWSFQHAWDAQVVQKLLPKLHGSQRKLEPVLRMLSVLCHDPRPWHKEQDEDKAAQMKKAFQDRILAAADVRSRTFDPLTATSTPSAMRKLGFALEVQDDEENGEKKEVEVARFSEEHAYLPISFKKIRRMMRRLQRDGFASFAEA